MIKVLTYRIKAACRLEQEFSKVLLEGLCAAMEQYLVTSNRESGEGRYDICLQPRNSRLPGVVIELKAGKDCSASELQRLAKMALQQIEDRQYDSELRSQGVQTVFKYGVAFSGKAVEVVSA